MSSTDGFEALMSVTNFAGLHSNKPTCNGSGVRLECFSATCLQMMCKQVATGQSNLSSTE